MGRNLQRLGTSLLMHGRRRLVLFHRLRGTGVDDKEKNCACENGGLLMPPNVRAEAETTPGGEDQQAHLSHYPSATPNSYNKRENTSNRLLRSL
jgi:hypothetical protein